MATSKSLANKLWQLLEVIFQRMSKDMEKHWWYIKRKSRVDVCNMKYRHTWKMLNWKFTVGHLLSCGKIFFSAEWFLRFSTRSMCNLRKIKKGRKRQRKDHNSPTLNIACEERSELHHLPRPLPPRSTTARSWMGSFRNRCISVVGLSLRKQTERFFMKKKGVQITVNIKYWQCKPPCFLYYIVWFTTDFAKHPKTWIWVTKESWGIDFS